MKLFIFVITIGLCANAFADTALAPITATRAIKVREAVSAMRTCIFAQAQRMVDQIYGNSHVRVSGESTSMHDDTSYSVIVDGTTREINPSSDYIDDLMWIDARWGKCQTSTYGQFTVQEDDSFVIQYQSADSDCGIEQKPDLVTDAHVLPKLVYKTANRSQVFDRTGNEHMPDESITGLQLIPSQASDPTKILLYNSDSGHPTAVTFDASAYASCLQKKLF